MTTIWNSWVVTLSTASTALRQYSPSIPRSVSPCQTGWTSCSFEENKRQRKGIHSRLSRRGNHGKLPRWRGAVTSGQWLVASGQWPVKRLLVLLLLTTDH